MGDMSGRDMSPREEDSPLGRPKEPPQLNKRGLTVITGFDDTRGGITKDAVIAADAISCRLIVIGSVSPIANLMGTAKGTGAPFIGTFGPGCCPSSTDADISKG